MKKIAAANLKIVFELSDDFLEVLGSERSGIQKAKREMADYVAGGTAGNGGLRIGGLQDLCGIVGENELEKVFEASVIGCVGAEKGGGAFAPGDLFGSRFAGEPLPFAKDVEDIGGSEGIDLRVMFADVTGGGHEESLAQGKDGVTTMKEKTIPEETKPNFCRG
jgi:hypothetical protein